MNPLASPVLNGLDLSNPTYYYTYDVVLANGQSLSDQVPINADADFKSWGLVINQKTGEFLVRFNRSGLYFLSNSYVHSLNLVSTMASPVPLSPPLTFAAGSRIGIDLVNQLAGSNTIQIVFIGQKLLRGAQ